MDPVSQWPPVSPTYYSDGTIQTNNEELYLYNNDVTYFVITCNSAFEYNNDITYYVITRNYQWTPEILTNNLFDISITAAVAEWLARRTR